MLVDVAARPAGWLDSLGTAPAGTALGRWRHRDGVEQAHLVGWLRRESVGTTGESEGECAAGRLVASAPLIVIRVAVIYSPVVDLAVPVVNNCGSGLSPGWLRAASQVWNSRCRNCTAIPERRISPAW